MPSPFPGMNPYLEQADVWTDFHQSYIVAIRNALRAQLDQRYIVRIEERLYTREFAPEPRRADGEFDSAGPWVKVVFATKATTTSDEAPVQVELPAMEIARTARVEVRARRDRQLIAVVEVLTPIDKEEGPHRAEYLLQRREVLNKPVHLVEIDLFRSGRRMPMKADPEGEYCMIVSRAEKRPVAGVWPIRLRDPLPLIPVPVRSPDPDARLDLQQLLHRCYDSAGYQTYIYEGTPSPALSAEDTAWAEQVLKPIRKKRKS
jgi:hypothetical protein